MYAANGSNQSPNNHNLTTRAASSPMQRNILILRGHLSLLSPAGNLKVAKFQVARTKRNKRLLCYTAKPMRTSRVQNYNNYCGYATMSEKWSPNHHSGRRAYIVRTDKQEADGQLLAPAIVWFVRIAGRCGLILAVSPGGRALRGIGRFPPEEVTVLLPLLLFASCHIYGFHSIGIQSRIEHRGGQRHGRRSEVLHLFGMVVHLLCEMR